MRGLGALTGAETEHFWSETVGTDSDPRSAGHRSEFWIFGDTTFFSPPADLLGTQDIVFGEVDR